MRHAPSGVPMAVWRHLGSASMQLHTYHMFSSLTPMCALNSKTSHLYATYQDRNPDDTCSEHSDVAKGSHRFCLKVKKKNLISCLFQFVSSLNSPRVGRGRHAGNTRWRFWPPEAAPLSRAESPPFRSPSPASPAQEAPRRSWDAQRLQWKFNLKPFLIPLKVPSVFKDLLGDDATDLQQTEANLSRLLVQHWGGKQSRLVTTTADAPAPFGWGEADRTGATKWIHVLNSKRWRDESNIKVNYSPRRRWGIRRA